MKCTEKRDAIWRRHLLNCFEVIRVWVPTVSTEDETDVPDLVQE